MLKFKSASSNSRVTSLNQQVTSSSPQVTSQNLWVKSSDPRVTSSNLRVTIYKLWEKSTSYENWNLLKSKKLKDY